MIVLICLPSSPNSARWLNPSDKAALLRRNGYKGRTSDPAAHASRTAWNPAQFREGITDSVTWLIFALVVLQCLVLGGLGTFSQLIIHRGLGFDVFTSQLLGLPFAAVVILLYFCMA